MAVSGASSLFGLIHAERTHLSSLAHGQRDFESFDGESWLRVNSKINWVGHHNKLWASLGMSLWREEIYFDENSTKIQELKTKICRQCQGKKIFQILNKVNDLITELTKVPGEDYATTDRNLDGRMEELLKIHHRRQGTKVCLPMDYLIYKKVLLCRHKALIAAALLRELVEQKILPFGIVRQFRSAIPKDNMKPSSHTWTVYRDCASDNLWICDPRAKIALNVKTDFAQLVGIYTKEVLVAMIERLNKLDSFMKPLPPQPQESVLSPSKPLLFSAAKPCDKFTILSGNVLFFDNEIENISKTLPTLG